MAGVGGPRDRDVAEVPAGEVPQPQSLPRRSKRPPGGRQLGARGSPIRAGVAKPPIWPSNIADATLSILLEVTNVCCAEVWHRYARGVDPSSHAQTLLEAAVGLGATFRDEQLDAILALAVDRKRLLVVERTGWGKSLVYFIATRLLRDGGAGPTVIVSPLLALMHDQLRVACDIGLEAETIHSQQGGLEEWRRIDQRLAADEVDVLLVGPERLANEHFLTQTLPSIAKGIGMLVVDEAHCISDWGHDFRPDYRRIQRIVAQLPGNVPMLATTATANDRVVADVEQQLGPDLLTIRGSLSRTGLRLQNVRLRDQAERLAWLAENLESLPGSGIVYTLTKADAKRVSRWLARRGIDAPDYHADRSPEDRADLENRLRHNDLKALAATIALGMGFDKPDLGFVVHFQRPGSVVAYYQQIGRAGRQLDSADIALLAGREDDEIADYFIGGAFPPQEALEAVLAAVEAVDEITVPALESQLNLRHGVIEQCLKVLVLEGAVGKDGGRYWRTPNAWHPDEQRVAGVTAQRKHELERMREYVGIGDCLMQFLARELDDHAAGLCGCCANCAGAFLPVTADPDLVREATIFLRRAYRPIHPRARWPAGQTTRRGNIPPGSRLLEGRALSVYGDAGWGRLVRVGKYRDEDFDARLLDAMVDMIRTSWQPDPTPEWVTYIPSLRDPESVPRFAARLAEALGLPSRDALRKIKETGAQKTMQNNAQQVANVVDAFQAVEGAVLPGPVLLFDDIVNSRWSLTVCGVLLREAGSGPVMPVVLAATSDD
jgi:ATP-dependent DNA helicase RecQ